MQKAKAPTCAGLIEVTDKTNRVISPSIAAIEYVLWWRRSKCYMWYYLKCTSTAVYDAASSESHTTFNKHMHLSGDGKIDPLLAALSFKPALFEGSEEGASC